LSIRHHLLLWMLVATLVCTLVSGLLLHSALRNTAQEEFILRLQVETALLADRVALLRAESPQEFAARCSRAIGVRVTLIDADGRVLGDSTMDETGLARMDNHLDRPEVQDARTRGSGGSWRRSDTTAVNYYYFARLVDAGGPVRFVRMATPESHMPGAGWRRAWIAFLLAVAAMLLLTGVAYVSVRRFSRSVGAVAGAAERVAGEHAREELPAPGPDEVSRLESAVRGMDQALGHRLAELDAERSLLASVIAGMQGGLLLVGSDRRVRLANQAVQKIFGLDFDPTGHLLAEVVRHPTANSMVERALGEEHEEGETVVRLQPSGHSFELQVTPLAASAASGSGQVLVMLFDISRLEALENVRREFVANVSHELRTPLTAIKAFVETLSEGGLDDRENAVHFLQIIQRHADRMGALIDDLTDLSLIETGAVRLDPRLLDAVVVVREVADQMRMLADTQEVELLVDLAGPVHVRADRRRLEQILTNLLDNAIKFNRPGGSVRVHSDCADGTVRLSVEDTGLGIPTDSQNSIFNRFYRVDKGRSRDLGGTGLGLAIVKHLMRLHGGQVTVRSELGQGSTFTLEFPAAEQIPDSA